MGSISIFHWIIFIALAYVYLAPMVRILQRTGYTGWWVLILFVPIANIVALWMFSRADWPGVIEKNRVAKTFD